MTEVPGAMIFRRRNSSINVVAIATASVFVKAMGSSQAATRADVPLQTFENRIRPQRAQAARDAFVAYGIVGKCVGGDTELASNKGDCHLRDRLVRAQQAPWIAESTQLQCETEPVRIAAAPLYGGEIGGAQGPVPDQFSFGDG